MGVNDMTFNQISTILAEINKQAGGSAALAEINTGNFTSVAQATLKLGYDPVLQAISQVIGRTVFSIRPYTAVFKGIRMDEQRFGAMERKIQIADKPFQDDDRYTLTDGAAVDQYVVNKPNILQTNIYGANVYEKEITIFRDQLDNAFRGPGEFAQFITMLTTNCSDMIEQAHENIARAAVVNFIGGKIQYDTGNVLHLLTEYNNITGLALTSTSLYQPANYKAFMQWVYSRVATISSFLRNRSSIYHMNVTQFGGTVDSSGTITGGTDKTLMKATPYDKQHVYMLSESAFGIEARVMADTYHDNYLRYADVEKVDFWQSIKSPDSINVTPSCINAAGLVVSPSAAVSQSKVLGLIFDDEAIGMTTVNRWNAATPFNARGGYTNEWFHFTDRYYNDFLENGVVLMMD